MLLLGSVKRLSIDIDIVIDIQDTFSIQEIFDNILSKSDFSRFEKIERITESNIQKAHYKFYYYPVHKTSQAEDYILLDVLFEKPCYSKLMNMNIDSTFVIQDEEPLKIIIPTQEDLLGDKLTAFAPNTTGIPYEKNGQSQAMEIIKQLYDIGCLFNVIKDLDIIRKTFYQFAEIEASYRNLRINPKNVLDDIFQTALCISTRGIDGIGDFNKLIKGIKSIGSYIFSESYHIERAIIDASKAAYLTMLIKTRDEKIEKFSNPNMLKDWIIELPINTKLNQLKKSNPEAFFYWYKIYRLSEQEQ
jgi:hypothetical protein